MLVICMIVEMVHYVFVNNNTMCNNDDLQKIVNIKLCIFFKLYTLQLNSLNFKLKSIYNFNFNFKYNYNYN